MGFNWTFKEIIWILLLLLLLLDINMDVMVIIIDINMDISTNPGRDGAVNRIHLIQDRNQWLSLLSALMRLQVPHKAGN
jgi:hypothetical protein